VLAALGCRAAEHEARSHGGEGVARAGRRVGDGRGARLGDGDLARRDARLRGDEPRAARERAEIARLGELRFEVADDARDGVGGRLRAAEVERVLGRGELGRQVGAGRRRRQRGAGEAARVDVGESDGSGRARTRAGPIRGMTTRDAPPRSDWKGTRVL
jgi:hypothetical protein